MHRVENSLLLRLSIAASIVMCACWEKNLNFVLERKVAKVDERENEDPL